jgi:hypothetical protein
MVTAAEMHAIRVEKSRVNHETYKEIYARISEKIKVHGSMGARDITVKIPSYVAGRPMYDVTHATRYVVEKFKLAGFEAGAQSGDTVYVSWKNPPPAPKKPPRPPQPPPPTSTPADTARRLDLLKMKLKSLTK